MSKALLAAILLAGLAPPSRAGGLPPRPLTNFSSCVQNCDSFAGWGWTSDDGTMNRVMKPAPGTMGVSWSPGSYWYSNLASTGVDVSAYDYFQFNVWVNTAPVKFKLQVGLADNTQTRYPVNVWFPEGIPIGSTVQVRVPIQDFYSVARSTAVEILDFNYWDSTGSPAQQSWLNVGDVWVTTETTLAVVGASMRSSDTVRVYFNAPVSAASGGATAGNYSLSPPMTINAATLQDNNLSVELKLASPLATNTTYTVAVTGVTSANGAAPLGASNSGTIIGHNMAPYFADDLNRASSAGAFVFNSGVFNPEGAGQAPESNCVVFGPNWIALSTAVTHYGSASLFAYDASTSTAYCGNDANLEYAPAPVPAQYYQRFYVYFPQSFFASVPNGTNQSVGGANLSNGRYFDLFGRRETDGTSRVFTEVFDSAGGYTDSDYILVNPNQWYPVELRAQPGTNPAQLGVWFNGRPLWTSNSINFSDAGAAGGYWFWGLGWTGYNAAQRGVYIDDIRVSTWDYSGQIELPLGVYSASVRDQNTLRLYLDRAVTADAGWTLPSNFGISPSLSITSVTVEDNDRAVTLHTAAMNNKEYYTVTVNAALLQSGAVSTAAFVGVSPNPVVQDDFNRPPDNDMAAVDGARVMNGLFADVNTAWSSNANTPQGVWNDYHNDGAAVNDVSIASATNQVYEGQWGLLSNDASATAGVDHSQVDYNQLAAPNDLYARVNVYFPTGFFGGMANSTLHELLEVAGSNVTTCHTSPVLPCAFIVVAYKDASGNKTLAVEAVDAVNGYPLSATVPVTEGAWHEIELHAPSTGTSVTATLYLDGAAATTLAANMGTAGYWNDIRLGLGYYSGAGALQHSAYFDDFEAALSGPLGKIQCGGPFTFSWTDPTIAAGSSIVRPVDILELRAAIGSLRQNAGLSAYSWTDPSLSPRASTVRAVHVNDLRAALNAVYTQCGQALPSYTDPTLTAGASTVRAVHLNDLRTAVQNAK